MAASDHYGVFLPSAMRMGKSMLMDIIVRFMDSGIHRSPTGTTARIVINHCLHNGFPFSVEYIIDPMPCYVVRLTGATPAPWSQESDNAHR